MVVQDKTICASIDDISKEVTTRASQRPPVMGSLVLENHLLEAQGVHVIWLYFLGVQRFGEEISKMVVRSITTGTLI